MTHRANRRSRSDAIPVVRGRDNIFADLRPPDPDRRLAKAQLARAISRVITERGLTQCEAAALIGIDQPKVSHVLRGQLADFSTERLMGFLTRLGLDIEIVIKPAARSRKHGRIRVA